MFICIILLLKEVKRSFLLTKRGLGTPETICMLSVQASLLAALNSVRIILLMFLI